ncbi:MAG: sulfite exporter TauE/SafE family protein [Burkholderiaceae bacterium]|nr:sulfite exporter TauE/SafE family protein [Burkholderiaceae bacterium]
MLDALTAQLSAAFLLALLGGAHCAGMCGGFVGALQLRRAPQVGAAALSLGYHAGRLTSYTAAGALAGGAGAALFAANVLPLQVGLLAVGAVMLLAIGASMFGARALLARLEPAGAWLWRGIAPLARRVYPPRSRAQAFMAGLAWGWIPCGMVYGALPLALAAGGAAQGALVMLAFGLGTLPNMLALDVAVVRLGAARDGVLAPVAQWVKPLAGAVIVVFGLSGLAHAARVAGAQHPAIAAIASICHR